VTALQEAVQKLSIAATRPACRDEQLDLVRGFLRDPDPQPPTLQLFGMPGTGKTAVVRHVLGELGDGCSALFTNGYALQRPTELYTRLYKHLALTRLGDADGFSLPEHAATTLEQRFRNGWGPTGRRSAGAAAKAAKDALAAGPDGQVPANPSRPCVLVIDEVDRCVAGSGKVFFRLLDWATLPHARLRIVTIANAMHLPEGMEPKTRSRMNTTSRVTFPPYTASQLEEIVRQRVGPIMLSAARGPPKPVKVFSDVALSMMCKQIAGHNGDGRRLLQLAASAVHQVLCRGHAKMELGSAAAGFVEVRHVAPVARKVLQDRFAEYVTTLNALWPLVCMAAVVREVCARESKANFAPPPVALVRHLATEAMEGLVARGVVPAAAGGGVGQAEWDVVLQTMVRVRLVDVLVGGEDDAMAEQSLRDEVLQRRRVDGAVVSMLQPAAHVRQLLELHPVHGEQLMRIVAPL
jgi:origin recognition complex subunit 1